MTASPGADTGPPIDHRLPGHSSADRRCISIDPEVPPDDSAHCVKCAETRGLLRLDPDFADEMRGYDRA